MNRFGRPRTDPKVRFDALSRSRPAKGCWVWGGGCDSDGYGVFWDGKTMTRASRASYEFYVGATGEKHVLHSCDNRACIRPGHLFLGTHAQNMTDARRKGRLGRKGFAHLSPEDVRRIRRSKAQTAVLVARFNIGRHQVARIRSGRRWAGLEKAA